jgi:hypothetical protein
MNHTILPHKIQKDFSIVQHIWCFLWSILEHTTNLKTYGGGLSKKKHIQIVKCVEKHYSTSVFLYIKGLFQHKKMIPNSLDSNFMSKQTQLQKMDKKIIKFNGCSWKSGGTIFRYIEQLIWLLSLWLHPNREILINFLYLESHDSVIDFNHLFFGKKHWNYSLCLVMVSSSCELVLFRLNALVIQSVKWWP